MNESIVEFNASSVNKWVLIKYDNKIEWNDLSTWLIDISQRFDKKLRWEGRKRR